MALGPDLSAASSLRLEDWIEADGRPGVIAAVLSGGRVASWRSRGRMGVDAATPKLDPRTVFYVASVSKQFTAACIAACEQAGTVDIAASIRRYLPELPGVFDPITLDHLLHHLGGTPPADPLAAARGLGADWWDGRGLWDLIEVLGDARALAAPPGEAFRYSNEGYWLLAAAVEHASGQALAMFAGKALFEPLGMTGSRFRDTPGGDRIGIAEGHAVTDAGIAPIRSRFHGVGDGGLLTNLEDLAKWDGFWASASPLGPQTPRRLATQGRFNDGGTMQYAWGVSVRLHRGLRTIGHGGSYLGYRAKFVRFPDQDFSVACLANADDVDVDAVSVQLADAVLGKAGDPAMPSWMQTFRDDGRSV